MLLFVYKYLYINKDIKPFAHIFQSRVPGKWNLKNKQRKL